MINDDLLEFAHKYFENTRSQYLEPSYYDTGSFYWLRLESFLDQKRIFMKKSVPMIIGEHESEDINREEDWRRAELKYRLARKIKE